VSGGGASRLSSNALTSNAMKGDLTSALATDPLSKAAGALSLKRAELQVSQPEPRGVQRAW
jgi:hypothetical protein